MLLMIKAVGVCLVQCCHLKNYETLKLWKLWNLFKGSLSETAFDALDMAYLAITKYLVV